MIFTHPLLKQMHILNSTQQYVHNLGFFVALVHEGLVDSGGRGTGILDRIRASVQQVRQIQQLQVSALKNNKSLEIRK